MFEPSTLDLGHSHGTAVAAIAAGGRNHKCSVGIAPDAILSACRTVRTDENEALTMETMHISQNSWSYPACHLNRRRLQTCPFRMTTSPCSSGSACANVDWSNPSSQCEQEIIFYCNVAGGFETDNEACVSFLDMFVECEYNKQSGAQ